MAYDVLREMMSEAILVEPGKHADRVNSYSRERSLTRCSVEYISLFFYKKEV